MLSIATLNGSKLLPGGATLWSVITLLYLAHRIPPHKRAPTTGRWYLLITRL